ncbi:MAG: four helix bundle protein [Candidatus Uhrbacteria bacterium]
MTNIKSFKDLRTWQESHLLTLEIYRLSKSWPREESYGLTSQIRRAAASIPSNIAEGMGRGSTKDLIRFLINARGSIQEVIYQLLLAKDLGYISPDDFDKTQNRYSGLNAGNNSHMAELSRQNPE